MEESICLRARCWQFCCKATCNQNYLPCNVAQKGCHFVFTLRSKNLPEPRWLHKLSSRASMATMDQSLSREPYFTAPWSHAVMATAADTTSIRTSLWRSAAPLIIRETTSSTVGSLVALACCQWKLYTITSRVLSSTWIQTSRRKASSASGLTRMASSTMDLDEQMKQVRILHSVASTMRHGIMHHALSSFTQLVVALVTLSWYL